MPYVTERRRAELDDGAKPVTPGDLNYLVTGLVDDYLNRRLPASPPPAARPLSYADINEVVGVLECAKLELYRRVAAPYEDRKRAENGDVYTPEAEKP
jgi:hypothetical protein